MNKIERVYAEQKFVQLAADALRRRHPHAAWLVKHGYIGRTGLTDRALEAAIERLEAWLVENPKPLPQTGQG